MKGDQVMRYLTAGESHGPQLTTIIEGVPAGLLHRAG
ncbi:chorismate synthase [Bacillus sp. SL00103]